MASSNPRYANYSARERMRKRIRAEGRPCAICGKPIDYELKTWTDPKDGRVKPHPLSYELDEIVPISLGGSPIDYDNLQPAHRACNQRRGNKPMKQQNAGSHDAGSLPTSRAW